MTGNNDTILKENITNVPELSIKKLIPVVANDPKRFTMTKLKL
jgi:hypothetical protein